MPDSKSKLKEKLKRADLALGTWVSLGHPAIVEIAANAGFDWIALDLEHSSITYREAEDLIRVADLCGCSPLVRLTSNDVNQIKRVMDSGAHGVIVPMVNSAQDAERAVSAVYYPPKGIRGMGLARAQGYGANFEQYRSWAISEPVIVAQIEHIEAVRNIDAILSVAGIDAYIIGPYDLSSSMGIPGQFTHPDLLAALETIKKAGDKAKVPGGRHIVEPDHQLLSECVKDGYRFIAFGTEIRLLDHLYRTGVSSVKQYL